MLRAALVSALFFGASCGGASSEPVRSATPPPQPPDPSTTHADVPAAAPDPGAPVASCGPTGAPPTPPDLDAAFEQAREMRDAGRFVEAADLYEAIARADPHHARALPAAELSLDALNHASSGARGSRAACARRIGGLATEYGGLFGCGAAGAAAEPCEHLELLRCEALRVEGDALAADDETARASAVFERVHATGCTRGADQALYNAAVLARRAGDAARADALVLELRRAYPESSVLRAPPP